MEMMLVFKTRKYKVNYKNMASQKYQSSYVFGVLCVAFILITGLGKILFYVFF